MNTIKQVAVIGAGAMGAGIAAVIANAGVPVLLFDRADEQQPDRSNIARQAVSRLQKANPEALTHPRNSRLITPLNISDDLPRIAGCDWIIEAVSEHLPLKQSLYQQIDGVRKPGSIVSSNTSTLPLHCLIKGLPDSFAADFCITHFFNPPRYMRLLEIVAGDIRPDVMQQLEHFADLKLGKTVIHCNDSPGFIANRLGIFWIYCALVEAVDMGLSIEEADALLSKPCGVPKTGVFGLMDLVGIDLMPAIVGAMCQALPEHDPFVLLQRHLPLIEKMISQGYTGRKGKGGFYRLDRRQTPPVKEAICLNNGEYSPALRPKVPGADTRVHDLRDLLSRNDKYGQYLWRVMAQTLSYAANLVGEVAEDITAIDAAMRLGYNWQYGPFELMDILGTGWLAERLQTDGFTLPPILATTARRPLYTQQEYQGQENQLHFMDVYGRYQPLLRPEGVLLLADIKRQQRPLLKNASASVWDIGDGVLCFEFTSKMNSLDPDIMALLHQSITLVKQSYTALVICNEGENFSVGANLGLAMFTANIAAWQDIEAMVAAGQQTFKALKYAPFPVVSAPSGLALGGGCEVLLHSDAIQAHMETYTGLVEVGVGLVPAWGGCKEMLARWQQKPNYPQGPMPAASKVFELISTAAVAKSAEQARSNLILRHPDQITMNRDRLLADAKATALQLAEGYQPPQPPRFSLPGTSGRLAFEMAVNGFVRNGKATRHDQTVSLHVADIMAGGDTDVLTELSEEDLLNLERKHFMQIIRHPDTLARIEHMLLTGKPLRN
ncbi:3-hydroxyacyl-CoA dehydrogenase/enoyl-CoA hydratase family protein [Aliamphritea hakodatensis]|uniref:3-hydroxyacyl-CoA dehydrogenase/enoyl-CoA hydratase family protein n=1 Tax=Aliamphritea hakodatensis TaxID=2895352 RepID=UPI0022FD5778|nr:3-hydroxyacyl-CoA dehydrogenase/enoyl-CoA hydratase family protein [Aliamphritea hakodatensis]